MTILPAFTDMLPDAPVGIVGVERDEETALPRLYYKKFPPKLPRRALNCRAVMPARIDSSLMLKVPAGGHPRLTAQLLIEGRARACDSQTPTSVLLPDVLARIPPKVIDRLCT